MQTWVVRRTGSTAIAADRTHYLTDKSEEALKCFAEALAIKGERIVAVGSNGEIEKHKGRARASLTSTVAP